jgi:hypothetical protein
MSINLPRDRELADTLYALVELAEHLKLDLNLLVHGLQEAHHTETGLAVVGGKSSADVALDHSDPAHAKRMEEHAANTALADKALAKTSLVQQKIESVIKLLLLNHTDAASILNEFEKIRTTKLLTSETFALAHILKANVK